MKLAEECKDCLFNSQMKKVEREQTDREKLKKFKEEVRALCQNPPANYCSPLLMRDINRLHRKIFGGGIDYSREKSLFNGALLAMEEELYAKIKAAPDPVEEALKFAAAANYIDFARIADLDEGAVETVIAAAGRAKPDSATVKSFKNRLKTAKMLCYIHDNCGEIVLDKILIRIIKELYPEIAVTSVVRGSAIINDVTEEDARFVGLGKYARVLSNGADAPGTPLDEINSKTQRALESDIVISKGLGNLETLYDEGVSAFYTFTCKCAHIAERFDAPLWSVVFTESKY